MSVYAGRPIRPRPCANASCRRASVGRPAGPPPASPAPAFRFRAPTTVVANRRRNVRAERRARTRTEPSVNVSLPAWVTCASASHRRTPAPVARHVSRRMACRAPVTRSPARTSAGASHRRNARADSSAGIRPGKSASAGRARARASASARSRPNRVPAGRRARLTTERRGSARRCRARMNVAALRRRRRVTAANRASARTGCRAAAGRCKDRLACARAWRDDQPRANDASQACCPRVVPRLGDAWRWSGGLGRRSPSCGLRGNADVCADTPAPGVPASDQQPREEIGK
jgi:hypothetical protein